MALVKQCDACNRVYIRNQRFGCENDGGCIAGIMTINSAGRKDKKFDLCDNCLEKLWKWLDASREDDPPFIDLNIESKPIDNEDDYR